MRELFMTSTFPNLPVVVSFNLSCESQFKKFTMLRTTNALLVSSSHRCRSCEFSLSISCMISGALVITFLSLLQMKCPLSVSAQGSYSTVLNILLVFLHISSDSATPFLLCEDKTAHDTQDMGALVFRCPVVLLFQALSAPKDNLINFSKLA